MLKTLKNCLKLTLKLTLFLLKERLKVYMHIWKNLKIRTPPPLNLSKVHILNYVFFIFGTDLPPPILTFCQAQPKPASQSPGEAEIALLSQLWGTYTL